MTIEIRPAVTFEEREAVYRFRYEIYVEEMGRRQRYADHARRRIIDPLDDSCHVLAAWEQNRVVGTIRTNHVADGDIGEYREFYALDSLGDEILLEVSITTRLMIAPHFRNTSLAARISCAMYEYGLYRGGGVDFIDCNAHLVRFFAGLGYRLHRDGLIHPEYGPVTVMRLNLRDIDHLERIRSPFRKYLRSYLRTNQAVAIEA